MNKIITIGREFGSGGRELGRRLAEELGIAYYDREIIAEIAKRTELSEQYVQQIVVHRPLNLMPITIGHSICPVPHPLMEQNQEIYRQQAQILTEMSQKSDCVLVGRCADYILKDKNPLKIFVYADMDDRAKRIAERNGIGIKEAIRKAEKVDRMRKKYFDFYSDTPWGEHASYDLMISSSRYGIDGTADVIGKAVADKIRGDAK